MIPFCKYSTIYNIRTSSRFYNSIVRQSLSTTSKAIFQGKKNYAHKNIPNFLIPFMQSDIPYLLLRQYHGISYNGNTDGGGREYNNGSSQAAPNNDESVEIARLSDPRTIVKHLDDYIIGQSRAKKILAVAIYNHYNRVRANLAFQQQQNNHK
ncbi:unnamed protein product [Cunninghamella echinulata]